MDAIRRRNKIEAIKIYRELTNTGLAEAKAVIDKLEAGM
jgi:ribosomal protein L7/L12